jgi:hypothetical protein
MQFSLSHAGTTDFTAWEHANLCARDMVVGLKLFFGSAIE